MRTPTAARFHILAIGLGTLCLAVASAGAFGQEMSDDAMSGGMMDGALAPAPAPTPTPTDEELRFFESRIRPLLIANCYGCHSLSAGKSKGGLRVDTREALLSGGESGPAIVPGDPDSSLLVRAVRYHDADYEMPPKGRLRDEEIALIEEWVAMGAPDPRREATGDDAPSPGTAHKWTKEDIDEARSTHWAYRPVANPPAPEVRDAAWPKGAIDAFVLEGLESRGLTPAPDADRRTLLRRASLDLTGLPPGDAELARFEADASPDAFARAVDRLLASAQFGERWGRHWLDVARYAESSGRDANFLYPHAWRYRDYAIDSFNADKPYDEFLVEQLAGDLLPARDDAERAEHLIATGYLAVGTKGHNTRGKPQFQMDLADEQIDAATQGMLGLTVACARCHDHKFDPIPQEEYYAIAGVFLSTETRYGTFEGQQNNHPSRLVELPAAAAPGMAMTSAQRSLVAGAAERVKAEAERAQATIDEAVAARRSGGEVPANLQAQLTRARNTVAAARNITSVEERFDEEGRPTAANLVAMGAVDAPRAVDARLLERGELDKPGKVVRRGYVSILADGDEPAIRQGESGRLEIARWIASPDNPLTARVWANRVWQHLFGQPLVPTPDNFGMSGQQPTHPELLDHLATRLVELGWSTKALIREIMLTRAYAMSSAFDADDASVDPEGLYLWRMPKKRLEAEAIRDSMLLAAGLLDLRAPGGSPINFAEGGTRGPGQDRLVSTSVDGPSNLRSVYLPVLRGRVPEMLEIFDFAEPSFVTGRRDATNVPTQALFLMNSDEMQRVSDAFARRAIEAGEKEVDRIRAAFTLAFGRAPTSTEIRACRDFLDDYAKAARSDGATAARNAPAPTDAMRDRIRDRLRQRVTGGAEGRAPVVSAELGAWSALCQALLLSAEFRTVD